MAKIKIYSKFERFWHWSQMLLIVLLAATGFEIHSSFSLFGYENAVRLHSVSGWVFLVLTIFAAFWMLVTGQSRQFIPVRHNVKSQLLYYVSGIFKREPHPVKKTAECKLNPLQRIVYFSLIILVFPVQLVTGFMYLFVHYPDKPFMIGTLKAVAVLHTIGAFLLIAFIIVHLYLITTGHKIFTNLWSMITGYEDLECEKEESPEENKQAS
jgi:formate dehydrogenase gamma subunit